jgi:hypothetical protein
MPQPYSYDLRQKVIQAIKLDGLKIIEASQLFNISRSCVALWLKRQDETGDFLALPNQPPGNGHKSLTGNYFVSLPKFMGIKPRWRWQNFGMGKLAHAPSHEP